MTAHIIRAYHFLPGLSPLFTFWFIVFLFSAPDQHQWIHTGLQYAKVMVSQRLVLVGHFLSLMIHLLVELGIQSLARILR